MYPPKGYLKPIPEILRNLKNKDMLIVKTAGGPTECIFLQEKEEGYLVQVHDPKRAKEDSLILGWQFLISRDDILFIKPYEKLTLCE